MATAENSAELPLVAADELKPFASLMILRSAGQDHALAVRTLCNQLARAGCKKRSGNRSEIVASGIDGVGGHLRAGDDNGMDHLWAFVYRRIHEPAWSMNSPAFVDINYELGLVMRRNDLIAVHCPAALRTSLQKWLDRSPRPPLERVAPEILNGAFLMGEAKGLWLRGAQSPTAARPDSKIVTGRRVQDSLSPFEDGGYALGSARAAFEGTPRQQALKGTVGTTPRHSVVWSRSTVSFSDFVALTTDVLTLVEDIAASGGGVEQPYQVLSQRVTSLVGVIGAFDIVVASAESLPLGPDIDEDFLSALATLEEATLAVEPIPGSPDFKLDVGLESGTAGTLLCAVVEDGGDFRFKIGYDPARLPTNRMVTREILDALHASTELINVYYDSGHVLDGRSIWRHQIRNDPFPGWVYEDFVGYDISREKPIDGSPSEIHAAIAKNGDTSLFAWVVSHYSGGWLICDDGSGEVADFVHLAPNGDLSLIHVKAAGRGARQVSVGPYEEVASQATKNLRYLDQDILYAALSAPRFSNPASWTNGQRADNRTAFLQQLQNRSARRKKLVVIVQPHLSQAMLESSQPVGANPVGANAYRLMLLETLLNASRGPITGLGGDLQVIASLS